MHTMKTTPTPITKEELNNAPHPVDNAIQLRHDPKVRLRAGVELAIVRRLLVLFTEYHEELGLETFADDGEEDKLKLQSIDEMMETLFSVDESHIRVRIARGPIAGKNHWVFLVFGNDGWDVISDYTVRLDHILTPFNDWVESEYERLRVAGDLVPL